jgi:hypothetical protein
MEKAMRRLSGWIWIVSCLVGFHVVVDAAQAGGEARFFRVRSQRDFLAGTLSGIAADPTGRLSLADRVDRLADLGEPFLFSIAEHPRGWVVGTGNSGNVLLVSREGGVETLFSAPEPEVFAVWADSDGTIFAGTSPEGKVYRISEGEAGVFFDPQETYIWGLARDTGGRLLVATGTEGRLYAVSKAGKAEVLFDAEDAHLRTLKVLADGAVLIGTAGEGLILRIGEDGEVRTLYDGSEPEVVALAEGPDGSCYAALLASEASMVDLAELGSERGQGSAGEEVDGNGSDNGDGNGDAKPAVTTSSEPAPAFVGSRPAGFQGARSVVLRISPTGLVERLWEFESETVYSLRWHRERLWVGTGLEGKLFSLQDRRMVLEKDVDERQIVALAGGRPGPVFATTNAAAVFRIGSEGEPSGTYTSAALDAAQVARFGTLRWLGELPRGSKVEFSARSGMSAEPDRTWSAWTTAQGGRDLPLADVPAGRYLQWRADLVAANGEEPVVTEVTISYVQENLAPRIKRFGAMAPGEIIVPANFNPGNQVFEPTSPSRGGIFTTLEPAGQKAEGRQKTLWKKGFQTLTWEADDPNEDELVYSLMFRRDDSGNDAWLQMAEELDKTHYSFDSAALPDGTFRFLLRAADRNGRGADSGLVTEEMSDAVVVDNSVPTLISTERADEKLNIEIRDALSPLRSVRVSLDAGEWEPLAASDGLLDGRREQLSVPLPDSADLLLLQVMDAAFNVVTFDLSEELP